jgi:hypothetical protein
MSPKKGTMLSREQFTRLKDALYQSKNGLERAMRTCPDMKERWLKLEDGHELYLFEVLQWIEGMRMDCWKYGPREVQERKVKEIELSQPRG